MILKTHIGSVQNDWSWYVTADGVIFEWTGDLHKTTTKQ